jgi:dihydroorotate dehydrogenase electron transfer subunit
MKKFILDLIVKENEHINEHYFVLKLTSNDKLPEMLPGQFVEIKVENSPTTFLRRPISVNFYDKELNELWLLIQIVGDGTRKLSEVQVGDTLNLILPLGNTFSIPEDKNARLLLIGGGVGFAPMLFLGAYLNDLGYRCDFLLGGRSEANMVQLNEFKRYGEVYITTDIHCCKKSNLI